jgi:OmpA-OmpF porin, OOP family
LNRLFSLICTLFSVAALAQSAPRADLEQAWLDPAGRGSLLTGNGQTLKQLEFRVGAALNYNFGNLRSSSSPAPLITDRLAVQLFGAVGIFNWLELGASVPIYAYQQGVPSLGLQSAGLGNPWLHAKASLLGPSAPVSLAVGLGVGLPIGTGAAQGNGGLELAPRVQVGKVFTDFQLAAEVGFLYRPTIDFSGLTGQAADKVGSQVWLAGTVTSVNASGPRGEFTVRGTVPVGGGKAGVEGQLGVRLPVGPVELFASAGPGFGGEPNTPLVRTYFGVAYANTPPQRGACVEGSAYDLEACPELDRDGDGVKNALDGAPLAAEDRDGYEDADGVAEPDNDGDGVLDGADGCPVVKGSVENKGCPDVDTDKDGLVDARDRCPGSAEDADGFQDLDGCPDPDNDGDGVLDETDRCPLVKGEAKDRGCPPADADSDGVVDSSDNCPTEAGVKENSGCPASKKQLVVLTGDKLQILEKVYFDTGKATIQSRSNALLDNVAQVLAAHPELTLIQIEGHTDNVGKPETNKKLSQGRADAVKVYLTKKAIDGARLRSVGFGAEKPAAPNDTPAGRDANRRVEFNLVP